MKTNYLPTILIGPIISLTLLVGMNLWAIERDKELTREVQCLEIEKLEIEIYGRKINTYCE